MNDIFGAVGIKKRVMVKRLLLQYDCPSDLQALATDTVLQQADLLAEFEVTD